MNRQLRKPSCAIAQVMSITGPFEPGSLLFRSMQAKEEDGWLFRYDIEVLSLDPDFDASHPFLRTSRNTEIRLQVCEIEVMNVPQGRLPYGTPCTAPSEAVIEDCFAVIKV